MARKNSSSNKDDQELKALIAQYESMRDQKLPLYMDSDELADIADAYTSEHRFLEAQNVIIFGLALHPNNTALLVEQAYLFIDTQRLTPAREVLDSITEECTEVKLLEAELLIYEDKLKDAEALLQTIEDLDDPETILEIAYLLSDMGYSNKAIPWLVDNEKLYDDDDEDFLTLVADCCCTCNKLEQAKFYYNKLIDKNAFFPPYWLGLSKCYYAEMDFLKTIETADLALAADENFGEGHLMRAHCFLHLGNEEEAVKAYQKSLDLKALPPILGHLFIGLAHSNQEHWQEALDHFELAFTLTVAEDDPLLGELYCNKALCLSKLGQNEQAHLFCTKAREANPYDTEPYLLEGRIYMAEGEFDKGREQWELAVKQAPTAITWHQIGTFYADFNLMENARFCFEQALKIAPDMDGLAEQLAALCLLLKDHKGFYKYSRLSNEPFNFEALLDGLLDTDSMELVEDIKKFMKKVEDGEYTEDEEDDNEEEKENEEEKNDEKDENEKKDTTI